MLDHFRHVLYICHFQIDYPSFNRDFYEEHEDIAKLSHQEVVDLKKKLGLKVRAYVSPEYASQ